MNFQTVRDAIGQKDGQYQLKISMFGTPTNVGEVEYNTKTGKPFQQMMIKDDTGEVNKVKILGDKMNAGHIGVRLAFDIAPNQYQSDPSRPAVMYYQGFWNDRAAIRQPAPAKKYTGQQPTANLIGDRNDSIEHQNALYHADAALGAEIIKSELEYKAWAIMSLDWIQTGKWSTLAEIMAALDVTEGGDSPTSSEPGDDEPNF